MWGHKYIFFKKLYVHRKRNLEGNTPKREVATYGFWD